MKESNCCEFTEVNLTAGIVLHVVEGTLIYNSIFQQTDLCQSIKRFNMMLEVEMKHLLH